MNSHGNCVTYYNEARNRGISIKQEAEKLLNVNTITKNGRMISTRHVAYNKSNLKMFNKLLWQNILSAGF
jgi:hypothetical protein